MENVVSVEKGGVAVEISVVEVETDVEAEVVAKGVEVETDDVGVTVEVVGTGEGLGKFYCYFILLLIRNNIICVQFYFSLAWYFPIVFIYYGKCFYYLMNFCSFSASTTSMNI